jgi:hypothetical protein
LAPIASPFCIAVGFECGRLVARSKAGAARTPTEPNGVGAALRRRLPKLIRSHTGVIIKAARVDISEIHNFS